MSPVSLSYQPGFGSSSHVIRPVVHASSRTPAADSSLSSSISKRVRDEPYGPSSAPPTIPTTKGGGATGWFPRGGRGAPRAVLVGLVVGALGPGGRLLVARVGGQCGEVDPDLGQTTGQVRLQRL